MSATRLLTAAAFLALAACEAKSPEIAVSAAWARETVAGQNGSAYLTIANRGGADRLRSASSPAARAATLHASTTVNGIVRMRALPEGLAVPAGGSLHFAPGGNHIMLEGLRQPLRRGQRLPLRLRFERSGERQVEVEIRAADSGPPAGSGH